jgi:hypothetical protein
VLNAKYNFIDITMIIQLIIFIATSTILATNHDRSTNARTKAHPFLHSKTCKLCDEMCPLKGGHIKRDDDENKPLQLSEEFDDIIFNREKVPSSNMNRKARHVEKKECANDSIIVDYILGPKANYNNRNVPGGKVNNSVEVWVQEVTSIEDATSDFEVGSLCVCVYSID